jgi:imidazolonepropionase-like amidohydrolase
MSNAAAHSSARLPKADLHLHAESAARIDRVVAEREGRRPYGWADWQRRLIEFPPGTPRLERMNGELDVDRFEAMDADLGIFLARVEAALESAAASGAVLGEVRFGMETVLRPRFMELFREAEGRVRSRHPRFYGEALISLWPSRTGADEVFAACLREAKNGLAGIDLLPVPYVEEADWTVAHQWASAFQDAGLGITAHAGEFSPANISSALETPGLTRIGHGIHVLDSPGLAETAIASGVVLECCITSNLLLGAVASLDDHPLRKLIDAGMPVTLNTDCPVRFSTDLAGEYRAGMDLGLSDDELRELIRVAVGASFTSEDRRRAMKGWVEDNVPESDTR